MAQPAAGARRGAQPWQAEPALPRRPSPSVPCASLSAACSLPTADPTAPANAHTSKPTRPLGIFWAYLGHLGPLGQHAPAMQPSCSSGAPLPPPLALGQSAPPARPCAGPSHNLRRRLTAVSDRPAPPAPCVPGCVLACIRDAAGPDAVKGHKQACRYGACALRSAALRLCTNMFSMLSMLRVSCVSWDPAVASCLRPRPRRHGHRAHRGPDGEGPSTDKCLTLARMLLGTSPDHRLALARLASTALTSSVGTRRRRCLATRRTRRTADRSRPLAAAWQLGSVMLR